MRIVCAVIAAMVLCVAPIGPSGMAWAAEKAKSSAEADRYIEAEHIIAPIVRDGRLANYLFITVRVDLPDAGDVWKLRARSHFLRDALLRATHRTSLADPTDDKKLNQAAAVAAFRTAAAESLGPRGFKGISIVSVQSLK